MNPNLNNFFFRSILQQFSSYGHRKLKRTKKNSLFAYWANFWFFSKVYVDYFYSVQTYRVIRDSRKNFVTVFEIRPWESCFFSFGASVGSASKTGLFVFSISLRPLKYLDDLCLMARYTGISVQCNISSLHSHSVVRQCVSLFCSNWLFFERKWEHGLR